MQIGIINFESGVREMLLFLTSALSIITGQYLWFLLPLAVSLAILRTGHPWGSPLRAAPILHWLHALSCIAVLTADTSLGWNAFTVSLSALVGLTGLFLRLRFTGPVWRWALSDLESRSDGNKG